MRFRYSNYMNGTHGAFGEYYLTETTALSLALATTFA